MIMLVFASVALSEENFYVGVLARLNMDEEQYRNFVMDGRENVGWNFLSHSGETFKYYDSLLSLQLALNAGEVGEVQLPEIIAEYLVNSNPGKYTVSCVTQVRPTYLAFGFLPKNEALRDRFNEAITGIAEDGTLNRLLAEYITNVEGVKRVNPEHFDGAETIKVALTGDLPPIDYAAEDGTLVGYNVALLTEIGKKLKVNIEMLDIDAGGRNAALASGRVDVVFWYSVTRDVDVQPDVPDGIILSREYYSWNKFLHVKLKGK